MSREIQKVIVTIKNSCRLLDFNNTNFPETSIQVPTVR